MGYSRRHVLAVSGIALSAGCGELNIVGSNDPQQSGGSGGKVLEVESSLEERAMYLVEGEATNKSESTISNIQLDATFYSNDDVVDEGSAISREIQPGATWNFKIQGPRRNQADVTRYELEKPDEYQVTGY